MSAAKEKQVSCEEVLAAELKQLENLNEYLKFSDQVDHYDNKFPKACNTCGRTYESHKDFIKYANELNRPGTIYTEEIDKVQEYRNCVCGSTLVIVSPNRRDNSAQGELRRQLFDQCVDKLITYLQVDAIEAVRMVREIFQGHIKKQL